MSIKIRPGNDNDTNFIISSWLNAYITHGNYVYKPSRTVYLPGHESRIKVLLKTCQIMVATSDDDTDQIIGYLVQDNETVHFCYVKNIFRKMGVGKKLMEWSKGRKFYSQHTSYSRHISKGLVYDPYKF